MRAELDPGLAEAVVARLRELEPSAAAVVVTGSYATGTAEDPSDLDMRAITTGPPLVRDRTWFVELPDGHPLHVSAGAKSVEDWLLAREVPNGWAPGFPVRYAARYLWATADMQARLGDPPSRTDPPAAPSSRTSSRR